MPIPAGTMFGPYELLGLIGAGGMGEVYRARDQRLGREVAVKALPAGLCSDPDRLRRFEVEARASSLLSHPNILTLYDIGTSEGQPYIVSELLEGENLRERLARGALPPRKAVEMAAAVADALAAAHGRGIVHRDLKPENLFLTRDGRIKILDFGIAKLTAPDPEKGPSAPTVALLTEQGVVIGTPGYMAPEQMKGELVDHRADIFAFGAILHEMLAGAPAFRRNSRIETVNAVLEADPLELPDSVAPAVGRIVRRCVEKNPDDRFQSALDLAFALSALSDVSPASTREGRRSSATPRVDWRIAAIAVVAAAGAAASVVWSLSSSPAPEVRAIRRFAFQPPVPMSGSLALSPDGSRVIYVGGTGTGFDTRLYVRALDQLDITPLAGTESARIPFFSPDGRWVAFAVSLDRKLKKIPAGGGAPVTICDVSTMLEGSWGPNGKILIAQREQGLTIVSADGGTPQPVTTPNASAGEIDHHAPHFLPGGHAFLFTIHAGAEIFRVAVRDLDSGAQRTLIDDGFDARYVPSGHVLYGRGRRLFAAPFDVNRLELTGPEVAVAENVETVTDSGVAYFSAASDGTFAFLPPVAREGRSLTWVDRSGHAEPLPIPPRAFDYPALSPDDRRLAVQISEGSRDNIYVYEFASDLLSRVTLEDAESRPIWSPDGKRLTYAARRKEERRIFWQPLDASAPPQSLVASRNDLSPGAWTPNSESLIFVETPPTSLPDIKILRVKPKAAAELLIGGPAEELWPDLSPDGRWVVYSAFDNGFFQVYVRPLAGGAPRQISTDGGSQPRWAHNGREVFYRRRRVGQFMRVSVETTPELIVGKPEMLFDDVYFASIDGPPNYDVSGDGRRFVFVKRSADELAPRPIHIVMNWFEELKLRVPVGGR